jgi:DNA-binding NarL/FixJ family response regulator
MTEGPLTVVIVDDHPLFSEALAERLPASLIWRRQLSSARG